MSDVEQFGKLRVAVQFGGGVGQFDIYLYRTERDESTYFAGRSLLLHVIVLFTNGVVDGKLINFITTKYYCVQVLNHCDFLTLSESLVQQIMNRPLEVSEVRKFQAMIKWATNKSESKPNSKEEFTHIMTRLKKDINLVKIAPNDLINVT